MFAIFREICINIFYQILDLLKKLWTFQFAACRVQRSRYILIKRSTIVDLFVHRVAQRPRYLTKHPKKVEKCPKIDCRAFAFSI